jgi:predicted GTPase
MAQAVALVLDGPAVLAADRGLTRAEVALAARVAEEGRGIVAVVNKLDAVPPHSRQQVSSPVEGVEFGVRADSRMGSRELCSVSCLSLCVNGISFRAC